MNEDDIMAGIRKYREEFAARHNHDVYAMIETLQQKEAQENRVLIPVPGSLSATIIPMNGANHTEKLEPKLTPNESTTVED